MTTETTFSVRRPQVVGESFDDEAVIVNLQSGIYYSLNTSGMFIWQMIEQNCSYGQILDAINNVTQQKEHRESLLRDFLKSLEDEGLIAVADKSEPSNYSHPKSDGFEMNPAFEKFSDMQDILLLDPIHEVDDVTGWPKKKKK